MNKICGIYKITNTITGDFYIGSSKDVKQRWAAHKCQSSWKRFPNNQMYIDFQKYGLDNFAFEILEEFEEAFLKKTEQEFIEKLQPTYNQMNAKGWDIERRKKYIKEYQRSDKGKESHRKYQQSDKGKESHRKYQQSDKGRKANKKYNNQLCFYNGETMTLNALRQRFRRAGIPYPTLEAKKYLIKN